MLRQCSKVTGAYFHIPRPNAHDAFQLELFGLGSPKCEKQGQSNLAAIDLRKGSAWSIAAHCAGVTRRKYWPGQFVGAATMATTRLVAAGGMTTNLLQAPDASALRLCTV